MALQMLHFLYTAVIFQQKQRTIINLATNYMQISTKTCDVISCIPVSPWSHGNLSKNVKLHVLFGFFILMGIVR